MWSKADYYSAIARETLEGLTVSWQEWTKFLTTASKLYKYPFMDQVMIYAQRPDATACADYDLWNHKMNRYVRRGSKGIALLDENGDKPHLRCVFDVADTGARENSRTPWLWTMEDHHMIPIMAMLQRSYGVGGNDLGHQVAVAARTLADAYWADNQKDFCSIVDDSSLQEYDEYDIGIQFKATVAASITYTVLSRCGLEPEEYMGHEAFMPIVEFNTIPAVMALGSAVSQCSKQILMQIGETIRAVERETIEEWRKWDEEHLNLHAQRGLSDPEPETGRTAGESLGQVRADAPGVLEGEPSSDLQPPAAERDAVPAPAGDRGDGGTAHGTADAPAAGERPGPGQEAGRTGVGAAHERTEGPGRGSDPDGAYQQLSFTLPDAEPVSYQTIEGSSEPSPGPFSFAQGDIDHVLRLGGNTDRFRERVAAEFEKQKPISEIAAYLPTLYHGGSGVGSIAAWYAEDGIHLSHGKFARHDRAAQILPWQDAAERIGQLLEMGQFASNVELAEAESYERSLLADELWNLYHDLSEDARNAGYLQSLSHIQGNGFPEESAWLTGQLANPTFRAALLDEYQQFLAAHQDNRALLRFHSHHLEGMLARLRDLDLPRRTFSTELTEVPSADRFITEDEIDGALTVGSGMAGSKGRIFAFFQESHTDKEKVDFLKHEYGIGGRSHALSGAAGSDEWHDGKGFRFKKAGCPDVHLTWAKAAKRITGLIQQGNYLSAQEQAEWAQRQEEADLAEADALAVERAELSIQEDQPLTEPEKSSPAEDHGTDYRLLGRLRADCDYFLGTGQRNEKHLWAGSVHAQIAKMRELYEALPEKPEWLTPEAIDSYAERMAPPYQVVVYHQLENGFDERQEYQTREEAEKAAQGYVDGTMEPDGFAYDGAAVYDLAQRMYLRIFGNYPDEAAQAQVARPDLSGQPVTREGDTLTIGSGESAHEMDITVSDEEYEAIRDTIPERTAYDPSAPVYSVGNTVYLDNQEYQITGLRDTTVELLPNGAAYPIFRAENRDRFETLLQRDSRNGAITEYLAPNPVNVDQDLMEVLAAGLLTTQDKASISGWLRAGESNTSIAQHLSELFADRADTLELLTGDTADFRTSPTGIEVEVLDDEEKKLVMLGSSWGEIAPIFRWLYLHEQEGFYRDPETDLAAGPESPAESESVAATQQGEKDAETPAFHSEPMTVYPGEQNHLPYDVVVERLHIDEPEPTPPEPRPPENFRILDDDLGKGGPKEKFWRNIKAIAALKQIEQENRYATPEEQHILSQYVGWGGVADAFYPDKPAWAAEYGELKELLTPEEYEAARASTLNAHYTSPTVIRAIYDTVEQMGFRTGNILEPSCGVGNFFGMLPESMAGSRLYGVELDSISGRIAKQLYPKADITVAGFETTDRRDFYDLAIGNVPFGQYQVNDKAYNKLGFNIHNYFFAKSLDQVRPGGVVAFVTSRYTMDAKDSTVRRYLAQRAELLGAIRLPNNAFRANAGTDVVSDILFLQKREHPIDLDADWVHLGRTEDGLTLNSYFVDHPEMVLGQLSTENTQYGKEECTVLPIEGADLGEQLKEAAAHIHGQYLALERELPELENSPDILPADPAVKNFSYTVVDGKVYFRENSIMSPVELSETAEARVKGMVELRQIVNDLIEYQLEDYPEADIEAKQRQLNTAYDAFTQKYGLINSRANEKAFSEDSSYYLLCSLENIDEDGRLESKADIFTKRTIRPERHVTHVDTPSEALAVSIGERGKVDIPFMAELLGKPGDYEAVTGKLQGVIFRDPMGPDAPELGWQTADEYLSGNVRDKLRVARLAAQNDPRYTVNVEALEKAQPKDLEASEIEVRLGATWIDPKYIQQFMQETFETPFYLRRAIEVKFSAVTAEWQVSGKNSTGRHDVAAYMTYGTDRANAYKILEDTLNLKDARVYDTIEEADGSKRRVLNKKETTLAQQKQQAIKDAFRDWIWRDPKRRETLTARYNELFNSTRPREYDGSHIHFVGMNPEIKLRPHQENAIAHVLYGGNTLLAHEVGAGKTFEMAAAAMESKRLGLCQKSMFVVPNHLTQQWANEFLRLYPSAKLLVTTKKDFEASKRKKFCARIAAGDYDAVIIGHSQFEKIPISPERQQRLLQEQINDITEALEELKRNRGENFTIKQMEKTRKSLQARLNKLLETDRKDDVITFEQLGVDRLFVDESQAYKNLFLYTKMRNVAGLSTSESQRSSDMFMKCRYLDEITGGRGVVFASGTPVSNSMTELYTVMRYLQYNTLQQKGLTHFDCWASTFGESTTAIELAPEGTGYRARTRFAKFYNLPELMNLFKEVADIKTSDQLNLPVPEAKFETVVVQPSEIQKQMVASLSERAAAVHNGQVDPSQDNMLKITADGRKIGLDQRLINPLLPDDPNSKLNACVNNVYRIWEEGKAQRLTQLLFCDMSTPKGDGTFNVYEDVKGKLIAKGVPAEEIAFIHDADNEIKKKELFAKVRTGQVRVLLGSTQKMGAGTNCQDLLVAVHHLDVGWRPSDMTQRNGRIIRQGNRNKQVQIYQYVTEGTFDAYLYQTLENKQKFISQIMTSKSPVRACDDVDEQALSYAEIKALCAGDSRIKEKMDLDIDVARLKVLKSDYLSNQYRLEDRLLKYFPAALEEQHGFLRGYETDLQTAAAHPLPKEGFVGVDIQGRGYSEKEMAGEAILAACKSYTGVQPVPLGSYRGFAMELSFNSFSQEYEITLKGSMTHTVTLGMDARGNFTRLDNALSGLEKRKEKAQAELANLENQREAAKAELSKPFPQEAELAEKSARLAELDAELNMDEHDAEEKAAEPEGRSSVLADLKAKAAIVGNTPRQHVAHEVAR